MPFIGNFGYPSNRFLSPVDSFLDLQVKSYFVWKRNNV